MYEWTLLIGTFTYRWILDPLLILLFQSCNSVNHHTIFKFVWEILPIHSPHKTGQDTLSPKIHFKVFTQHKKTRRKSIGFRKPYRLMKRKRTRKFPSGCKFVDNGSTQTARHLLTNKQYGRMSHASVATCTKFSTAYQYMHMYMHRH